MCKLFDRWFKSKCKRYTCDYWSMGHFSETCYLGRVVFTVTPAMVRVWGGKYDPAQVGLFDSVYGADPSNVRGKMKNRTKFKATIIKEEDIYV